MQVITKLVQKFKLYLAYQKRQKYKHTHHSSVLVDIRRIAQNYLYNTHRNQISSTQNTEMIKHYAQTSRL